jgi:hypothetical protein
MTKYQIKRLDITGSVKGRVNELELPDGSIPMGFEIRWEDVIDPGRTYPEWEFFTRIYKSDDPENHLEWIDDTYTECYCVIGGKLKRFKILSQIYYAIPISNDEADSVKSGA